MRLTLVRHGETEENKNDICQGQLPGKLSEDGLAQVKKLALRLKDETFDIVYCSDLQRCKDTCAEIMKFHPDVKVEYSKEIRESSKGVIEGLSHADCDKYYEEHGLTYGKDVAPGGETYNQLCERVLGFYDKIVEKHHGQRVLWVGHGGSIYPVVAKLKSIDFEEAASNLFIHNTSVTIIKIDDNKEHALHLVDCTEHL